MRLPVDTLNSVDYKHLINRNVYLCPVFADPVTFTNVN